MMNPKTRIERVLSLDLKTFLSFVAQFKAHSLRFMTVMAGRFREDVLTLRAASLVYTTLLSLVPFLAVTFSVLKAFGVQNQIEPFLAQALEPLGSQGAEITRRIVEFVNNLRVGVLGALGVAVLFFTVVSLVEKIEDSLNHIWRVRHPRSLARRFSDYLSVVLVGPVLVFTALALTASAQSHWLVQRIFEIKVLGFVVATRVLPFVFLCAGFTFLYKFLPHTRVRLSSALVGGVTAGILWHLAGIGFAAFVAGSARYTAIYSSFAILILFLVWLYVGWLVILLGGEAAYLYQHPYLIRAPQREHGSLFQEKLALLALVEITRRHFSQKPPWRPEKLSTALSIALPDLEDLIDRFVQRGILLRTAEPEGIALGRPPEQVTVVEILNTLRGPEPVKSTNREEDSVLHILDDRDRAVRQGLEGITLRSLAMETSAVAPEPQTPVAKALVK